MRNGIEPGILNSIVQGDCVKSLAKLPAGTVDLAFADPPFNIGYEYDVYDDRKSRSDYLAWTRSWIEQVYRVLKPSGAFWLAIGDEYAAESKVLCQDLGFISRSWVIWYYTFGVNCTRKFTRSHAHLFYFVKDAKNFTFNDEDLENRIPSARQLVYNDRRANPRGRLPDDTWILRPQDLTDCFTPAEDTWYFPRVAGTFSERAGFHGCQMPEQLLGRIIRLCSKPGELVIDPFSGSATTLAVSKKLGRRFVGFELSKEYVERGTARLEGVRVGDPLEGAPEPLMSAPSTPSEPRSAGAKPRAKGKASESGKVSTSAGAPERGKTLATALEVDVAHLIRAYEAIYDGYSLDRVLADPELSGRLAGKCKELGLSGAARDWHCGLMSLRKAGKLQLPVSRRTEMPWEQCDRFLFASEIAWHEMHDRGTLDEILCDPVLAEEFDSRARKLAPGFTALEYRWGALRLRKTSSTAQARSTSFKALTLKRFQSSKPLPLKGAVEHSIDKPGLYLVEQASGIAYVGSALNLRARFVTQFAASQIGHWEQVLKARSIRVLPQPDVSDPIDLLSMQKRVIQLAKPSLNALGPSAA